MGEMDQKIQISSCKISKSWGYNVRIFESCYESNLKSSHRKKKNFMLTRIIVIISQYVHCIMKYNIFHKY